MLLAPVVGMSVLWSVFAASGESRGEVVPAPSQLRAAITRVRRDAEIVRRDEIDWKSCEAPERDQVFEADFNGDGRTDYAALLRLGKKTTASRAVDGQHQLPAMGPVWLVVFLAQKDGSFRSVILDRHGNGESTGLLDIIIALQPPGVIHEISSGRQVQLALPGIARFWCERSGTVFFWSRKAERFESVWTGD